MTKNGYSTFPKVLILLENKRMNEDNSNNTNVEMGQNTKNSAGDLRILAVTQTQVEDHQLMLV